MKNPVYLKKTYKDKKTSKAAEKASEPRHQAKTLLRLIKVALVESYRDVEREGAHSRILDRKQNAS